MVRCSSRNTRLSFKAPIYLGDCSNSSMRRFWLLHVLQSFYFLTHSCSSMTANLQREIICGSPVLTGFSYWFFSCSFPVRAVLGYHQGYPLSIPFLPRIHKAGPISQKTSNCLSKPKWERFQLAYSSLRAPGMVLPIISCHCFNLEDYSFKVC